MEWLGLPRLGNSRNPGGATHLGPGGEDAIDRTGGAAPRGRTEPERVFVLTFETKKGSVLDRLYELAVIWHTKKENNEVDTPLRLMLFQALLEHWKLRLRALEASEELRNLMVQHGLATLEEGVPELQWGYQRWNPTLEKLEPVTPMHQSQVVETLVQLESTISAPNALVQFHATRKLVEKLEGDTITFLMGVGLRDPMARPGV